MGEKKNPPLYARSNQPYTVDQFKAITTIDLIDVVIVTIRKLENEEWEVTAKAIFPDQNPFVVFKRKIPQAYRLAGLSEGTHCKITLPIKLKSGKPMRTTEIVAGKIQTSDTEIP